MTNGEALARLGAANGAAVLVDPQTGRRLLACATCDALIWFDASEGCVVAAYCDACEDAHERDDREPDDSMDGDHESALASAGMGTDEDYGYYGGGDE